MVLLEVQTALCILSLLCKRRGVMWVNKIFYVPLSGCDSCKSKLHNTEIPQTAYLLGVQAKFPNYVFVKHRKRYFTKKYLLQSNSQNRESLKYVWNVYCVITIHEWDLQPQKPQSMDVLHWSRNIKYCIVLVFASS